MTGSECPESIRDLKIAIGEVKQSLSPMIQNDLLGSPDFLLRSLMTVNCQDELFLKQSLSPSLNSIRKALGEGLFIGSHDDRHGDSEKLRHLEQRANYRMSVLQIRLRRLCTEKTQECWDRLDDTFWTLSRPQVRKMAESLLEAYSAGLKSSGDRGSGSQSNRGRSELDMARLSDRVHEAIMAATENKNIYVLLATVRNSITFRWTPTDDAVFGS